MWSMFNRTILWELIKIFVLALVSITGLLLLAVVVMEAQNQGLGPLQILVLVPLVIPSTMPYTIPATTLFATCVVYGRLAHDNEVLAIRAAGINILHVVVPAAFLGLIMSAVTAVLYYEVIPTTYNLMKSVFLTDVENVLYGMLKKDLRFSHPKLDYAIHVKKVEGRKLIKPTFIHKDPQSGKTDIVAEAREAELRVDLHNAKLLIHMRDCTISSNDGKFNGFAGDKIWTIDIPPDIAGGDRKKFRRTDMTWNELLERKSELEEQIHATEQQIALGMGHSMLANPPDTLPKHVENLRNQRRMLEQQVRDLEAELHRRPALSLGCLCFVLVGCPVGIWFSRSDYLSAFVTCFLPIVLLYYPLILCGENLAKAGTLAPALAVWFADLLMGVLATFMYWRLLRH